MPIEALARQVDRLLTTLGPAANTQMPGLFLLRETAPTAFDAMVYEPIVCLILQGAKETTVGDRRFTIASGQCVVVSHDVPVVARITHASEDAPYVALVIRLDVDVLRGLYDELGEQDGPMPAACCMQVAPVDEATVDVLSRYVGLLEDRDSARVLLPLVRKELHFRLVRSASGATLRSLLRRDSHANHVARAIRALRARFRQRLTVDELAREAGMSASSFHRHFKAVTRTTPLQYQKDLRLTEARRQLRAGRGTVSTVAYDVGYESPSQFSREYARKFGAPPRVDLAA